MPGEPALDDDLAARLKPVDQMSRHQRGVERRERRAGARAFGRRAFEAPFARRERAALIAERRQRIDACVDEFGDILAARLGRVFARQRRKFPPAHEAGAGHGVAPEIDIGEQAPSTSPPRPPTAMTTTHVPVETSVNGAVRAAR
jgi:hypothetical protein